ncbi:MAG: hypothetical protein AAGD06_08780, partial [Acidobacteriota bacterium]
GGFLRDLRSHRDGRFQLYFLTFKGRDTTDALRQQADRTGGETIPVEGGRPADVLHAFATALSRSQGYEGRLLDKDDAALDPYRGAERIRLLAMVKEEADRPLGDLTLKATSGGRPVPVDVLASPEPHQYEDGGVYHYVAGTYDPTGAEVEVDLEGTDRWKMVALPEYRLTVDMEAFAGACDSGGTQVENRLDVGEDLCLTVELARWTPDGDPEPVGLEVTAGEVEGEVVMTRSTGEVETLVGRGVGELAQFQVQQSDLAAGNYGFRPVIRIRRPSGTELRLPGERRPLEVQTLTLTASPPRLDLGRLFPGGRQRVSGFKVTGNYKARPARVEAFPADALPECVSLGVGTAAVGQSFQLGPEQEYQVVATAEPECGSGASAPQPLDFELRLTFESAEVPPVQVPVSLVFDGTLETLDTRTLTLRSGEYLDLLGEDGGGIPLPGAAEVSESFEARFDPGETWPGDDLALGFLTGGASPKLERKGTEISRAKTFQGERLPRMRVEARPCCDSGLYEGSLMVIPVGGGQAARVPLEVTVEHRWWPCWRPWIVAGVLCLLLFLLLSYLGNMFFSTSLLRADQLAARLVPLRWDDMGGVETHAKGQRHVERLIRKALTPRQRVAAWLGANPLVFGLPGREYAETVELTLVPHNDVHRSMVRLVPERDLFRRLQADPEGGRGKLYARAVGSGVQVFGVPGKGYRYGRLVPKRYEDRAGGDQVPKAKLDTLRREKLLAPVPDRERQEGLGAGWQVG